MYVIDSIFSSNCNLHSLICSLGTILVSFYHNQIQIQTSIGANMSGSSKSSFFRIKSPTEIKILSSVFYSSKGKFIIGLPCFLGYILNFRFTVIAPKCYQHEKHLFPFHSFCSLFLSKCSRWGILALILFSPTHFGKCNPNPIYTFYCLCWSCATLSLLSKLTLSFSKMF